MVEGIAFENGQISNCEGLVTLTLDRVVLYSVVHHSSTSTHTPNFTEIEETICGWTYVHTYVRTYAWTDGHLIQTLLGRLCQRVNLIMHSAKVGWLVAI